MATLLTAPPDVTPAVFALMIAGYSAGAHADGPRSLGGALVVVGTIVVVCLVKTPEDILFPVFIFGLAPWAIGRVLRGHTLIARELGEKEVMLAAPARAGARERGDEGALAGGPGDP